MAQAAGHRDRHQPLTSYCLGLLLPGERKSVEPMAARLDPNNVRRAHQSLHHVVAVAPWNDQLLLQAVRQYVLPLMTSRAPISAWVVDDTGFPKKGKHSVGVARQYCGQVGKQDNCQVAVSLSISTASASLPLAYELALPETWSEDPERRRTAGVPEEVVFRTKPLIAAEQIRQAVADGVPRAPVVADAAYGNDTKFRQALLDMGLEYVVGIQPTLSVWPPGKEPLPPKPRKSMGRPPKLRQRAPNHQPVLAKDLAAALAPKDWQTVPWRDGTKKKLQSRFAAVRVRPANRDYELIEPLPEQWLLIEWPEDEAQPTKYWLGSLAADTSLTALVATAKQRWIIERDYEELKQELGLGHYEGRGWRGFHHHATLCIAAYGFLIAERSRFSPSARAGQLQLALPEVPPDWKPRGASATS
ncbi:MAG: IS701 family transposase [Alphaproteobacteria bacterium]